MRKESTAYFRISFRKSDFYLGELFPHLASLKDERGFVAQSPPKTAFP